MNEMIAYCGLDCSECDAFRATQAEDMEQKKKIAERWSNDLKTVFTPDDVTCDGCKTSRISGWCQKICRIRPCAIGMEVKTCAHCDSYSCNTLDVFLLDEPDAKINLQRIKKTIII